MAVKVLMPKMGLTMTEGTIGEWKKKEGDQVKKGDLLFTVETDKLVNEIAADADGILLKILCQEGETAPCKETVAWIGQAGELIEEAGDEMRAPEERTEAGSRSAAGSRPQRGKSEYIPATPLAKKLSKEKGIDLTLIPVEGLRGVVCAKDVKEAADSRQIKLSPMAAKLAKELGVDPASFASINRIMKADILEAAGQPISERCMSEKKASPAECVSAQEDTAVKVTALRRSIARNMSASWSTSPRVTYTHPVDATELKAMRACLKEDMAKQGLKLTYNHIIMLATAKALTEYPDINASFQNDMLTRHRHVNLGLAVAKGDGLLVPNVKACEQKTLREIAAETERLIEETRSGRLQGEDMRGGTFTISSLGPYGITSFSPIINQPELAILGVCNMVDTPIVRNGEIVVRCMMNLSLTADHRVVDGVMAAQFLARVVDLLENPYKLLA